MFSPQLENLALLVGCLLPLMVAAYTDVKSHLVPDKITLPVLLAGGVNAIYSQQSLDALLGMVVAFGIMLCLGCLGGVGGGDIKLAAGLGMWFGLPQVMALMFLASLLGIVWGAVRMYRLGILDARLKTFFTGLYLRVVCGATGAVVLPKLPEDPLAPVPPDAIPFGTCLAVAAWIIWLAH